MIEKIKVQLKQIIDDGEYAYSKKNMPVPVGYVWEHSLHVAAIARKLAVLDGLNPELSELIALFHDAGKFQDGAYHQDDTPEEVIAAEVAEKVLSGSEYEPEVLDKIRDALQCLYNEALPNNPYSDLVHDADFLAKFGLLGIGVFFTKTALRGQRISDAILKSFSKELTYAAVLPDNMRTDAGREIAVGKREKSIAFFSDLLDELRNDGIGDYRIQKKAYTVESAGKTIDIYLVSKRQCDCQGLYQSEFSIEKGLKCRKLILQLNCQKCDTAYQISFCLPEII